MGEKLLTLVIRREIRSFKGLKEVEEEVIQGCWSNNGKYQGSSDKGPYCTLSHIIKGFPPGNGSFERRAITCPFLISSGTVQLMVNTTEGSNQQIRFYGCSFEKRSVRFEV